MNSGEEWVQGLGRPGLDGRGVLGVEALDVAVEGLHQLGVRDRLWRRVEAGGGDDGRRQGFPPKELFSEGG